MHIKHIRDIFRVANSLNETSMHFGAFGGILMHLNKLVFRNLLISMHKVFMLTAGSKIALST